MDGSKFKEIRTDYVDENGAVSIDGWRTPNDDEGGEVIGIVIKATVYYRDPEFQFDPYVKEMVDEVIAEQQKEIDSLKEKVRKAIADVVYTPGAKPRPEFTDGSPLEKKLSLINSGVDEIMGLL